MGFHPKNQSIRKGAHLKVPSAIIPDKFNYVLRHAGFKEVKLVATIPFHFDKRLQEDMEKLRKQLKGLT